MNRKALTDALETLDIDTRHVTEDVTIKGEPGGRIWLEWVCGRSLSRGEAEELVNAMMKGSE